MFCRIFHIESYNQMLVVEFVLRCWRKEERLHVGDTSIFLLSLLLLLIFVYIMMLCAWGRTVGGIVVRQGVLSEELAVIPAHLLGLNEFTNLFLYRLVNTLGRPLVIASSPDGLTDLEGWLRHHYLGRNVVQRYLFSVLEP